MSGNIWRDETEAACPKQPWVMAALADDETLGKEGSVPPAIKLHLATCLSCRALADQLMSVASGLRDLSTPPPPDGLHSAAHAQLQAALDAGAVLTGRVKIPEDDPAAPRESRKAWRRYGTIAIAAALLAVVGLSLLVTSPDEVSIVQDTSPTTEPDGLSPALVTQDPTMGRDGGDVEMTRNPELSPSPVLVDAEAGSLKESTTTFPRCRHRTAIEAANCERTDCVHSAIIVPFRRGDRERLDIPHDALSTPRRSNDHP